MPARLVVIAPLILLLLAPAARAEKGELAWMVGAGTLWTRHEPADGVIIKRTTPLAHGGVRFAVSDFWELGGVLRVGAGIGGGPEPDVAGHALLEARAVLDALTWVPFALGGVGVLAWSRGPDAWAGRGSGPEMGVTAHVGAGLAWRPKRRWSVNLSFRYHVFPLALDDAVGPLDVALTWSLYRVR